MSIPLQEWKAVLGEDLFYHFGAEKNILKDLYQYIPLKSKILDCGCGFGGPARQLIKDLHSNVTGITNLPDMLAYINDFQVILDDLEEHIPREHYDIALFLDSFTHLSNNTKILKNLYSKVDKIIIRDFVSEQPWVREDWAIRSRTKKDYYTLLQDAKYKIIDYKESELNIANTSKMWYNNLISTGNLENKNFNFLKEFCNYWLDNNFETPFKVCIIYAIK